VVLGNRELTLDKLIDQATAKFSSKKALIYNESTLTYAQLRHHVDNMAKGLIKLGVNKGDKVGIWMVDNPAWIYSYFAAAKARAVIVPINARYKQHEMRYVLKHGEIRTIIISDLKPEIQDYVNMIYEVSPKIRQMDGFQIHVEDLPYLRNVIVVGPRDHAGTVRIDRVIQMGAEEALDDELRDRQKRLKPEDIAVIQYTSGTTSFPKGCILTHEIVVRNAQACALRLEIEEGKDIFYDVMPPFHVLGICFGIIPSIAYGCCRIGTDHFDPLEALKWIEREKCTVHSGMADMLKAELDHPDFNRYDLSSLRTGFCSDSPIVFKKVDHLLPNWRIFSLYGLSEVGGNLATTRRNDPVEVRIHTHGRPHDGLEVKIVDLESNSDCPIGVEGEICTRGWTVMKGYYKDPEATAKTIDQDGWLHTGDKGLIDNNGRLRWIGRIKDTIKVGGENVAPKEIEDFIILHPKVQAVQVVGVEDPMYTEVVAAFVEVEKGMTCPESEIVDFCRGRIASFKIPRYVRFVETWPMSATKVQKSKLKEQLQRELKQVKASQK
jgi:fatty-acyl-CoA synthase